MLPLTLMAARLVSMAMVRSTLTSPFLTGTRTMPRGQVYSAQSSAYPESTPRDALGGASRFFYCAKASKKERELGLEAFGAHIVNDGRETSIDNAYQRGDTKRRNTHPTVKPIELMRWLCRLVTPPGGLIVDPFCGSGSTGCAAVLEGFNFLGIEREPEFAALAAARVEHHASAA